MIFHYIPDMMPTSDTTFNSRNVITSIYEDCTSGVTNCLLKDNFIEISALGHQDSTPHYIQLSTEYSLINVITSKSASYYDTIVINHNTGSVHILMQRTRIFLFDCPNDLWLLFQALLMTTTKQSYTYTRLSSEFVENNRFSLSKLLNSEIADYIVSVLVKDNVLHLAH